MKNNLSSENQSPKVDKYKLLKIGIVLALAFFYDISPIDLIPDIPIIGWGDDLIVTILSFIYTYKKSREGKVES